jgi:DnaJ-class molecular chaperone
MNAKKDYYAVLGVSPSVDEIALGVAYRTLLKKYHPDLYRGSREKALSRTREIVEAYDALRDSAKRRMYDAARTDRGRKNAGRWTRGRGLRSGPNARPSPARNSPRPYGPKSLWPMIIVGILCFILAAKLLYYGL